jgi:hypothetical protein
LTLPEAEAGLIAYRARPISRTFGDSNFVGADAEKSWLAQPNSQQITLCHHQQEAEEVHVAALEEAEEALVEASGAAAEEVHEAAVEVDPEEVAVEDAVEVEIEAVAGMPGAASGLVVDNIASSTVSV